MQKLIFQSNKTNKYEYFTDSKKTSELFPSFTTFLPTKMRYKNAYPGLMGLLAELLMGLVGVIGARGRELRPVPLLPPAILRKMYLP